MAVETLRATSLQTCVSKKIMKLQLEKYIVLIIKVGLLSVLFLPLLALSSFYFPFIVSRDIVFRIIIEFVFVLYLYLVISDPSYRLRFNLLTKVISAFFIILVTASIVGSNFYVSLWGDYERMSGLFHLAHIYLYFLILINIFKTKDDWLRAFSISVFVSLITIFIALQQYFDTGVISKAGGGQRLSSSLGNAAFFASYLLLNLFLAIYLFWRNELKVKLFFYSIIGLDIFLLIYELYNRATVGKGLLVPLLTNKTILISLIIIQLLSLAAYLWKNKYQLPRVLLFVIIIFNLFVLYSTQTRGAVVGLYLSFVLIAILSLLCLKSFQAKKLSFWLAIITLLVLVIGPITIYLNRNSSFVQNQPTIRRFVTISATDITTQSRLTTWRGSWQGLWDKPVLGWGVENYKNAFNKYFPTEIYRDRGSQLWFDRAHNIVMDIGVTSGLVGLVIYFLIYLIAGWQLFKNYRHNKNFSQSWLIAIFLIAYFVQNLFVFDTLNSEIIIFLIFGFIVYLNFEINNGQNNVIKNNYSKSKSGDYSWWPLLFLLIIFLIFTYQFNIKVIQANHLISKQLNIRNQLGETYSPQVKDMIIESINLSPIGRFEARQQLGNYAIAMMKSSTINRQQLLDLSKLAIDELKKSIQEEPQNVRHYMYLATVYNGVYRLDPEYPQEAIDLLTKSIPLSPTRPQIYSERCQAYLNLKKYDEGIADCQKSLELSPGVMESHWNLFLAYIVADREKEADQELILAKELGDKIGNPISIDKLINVYSQFNKWQKVIEVLAGEIKIKPDDALLHAKLAVAYKEIGDKVKAKSEVLKAVELDSSLKAEAELFLKLLE